MGGGGEKGGGGGIGGGGGGIFSGGLGNEQIFGCCGVKRFLKFEHLQKLCNCVERLTVYCSVISLSLRNCR